MRKIVLALGLILLTASVSYAKRVEEKWEGAASTGIITDATTIHRKQAKEAVLYNAYAVTTTKVYNGAAGTAVTDGWVDVRAYNDDILLHYDLDDLNSTNVIVVAEGLITSDNSSPMTLFSKTFTATDEDYSLPICEGSLKYLRVSVQATGAGVNSITVKLRAEGTR